MRKTLADGSPASSRAQPPNSEAPTPSRPDDPGSWEADHVQRLVKGTVGWDDEYLSDFAGPS
jgi:hypothetical protein